jgi:hypothetical protein
MPKLIWIRNAISIILQELVRSREVINDFIITDMIISLRMHGVKIIVGIWIELLIDLLWKNFDIHVFKWHSFNMAKTNHVNCHWPICEVLQWMKSIWTSSNRKIMCVIQPTTTLTSVFSIPWDQMKEISKRIDPKSLIWFWLIVQLADDFLLLICDKKDISICYTAIIVLNNSS